MGADEQLPAASAKVPEDAIRIKFLCSHGGKILPKPDGQLRYVGGDTRLVSFSKNITFADLSSKLEKLFGPNLSLKYQLPNEDLDTLISVTCDDDVENLVEEYDKNEARDGASRLRAFLFPRTGASVSDSIPCSCHIMDDAKGLTVSPPHCACHVPAMFQMPDCLLGLENAYIVHGCRQQHQDGDSQVSPRPLGDDKGLFVKSLRPISPTAAQREYPRQQSTKFIDSVGRGPALTTSALGPLVSNHQHMWDRRRLWDEGVVVNQRGEEKRHMDLNSEAHHHNHQQDVGNGVSMVRVASRDRLVPGFMEVTGVDTPPVFDRQHRPQSMPRADLHPEVVEESRQDGHYQGNTRHYKPPDVQRAPVSASEMQWGMSQPMASAFHTGGERTAESRRNSGDSEEGSYRKLEGHVGADGAAHTLPVIITADGLKMHEAYRHEDPMVKQQVRHGEFEQVPYDQFHHLGKGHFQQAHWQLHEPQEQQQHQISSIEPPRMGHSAHGMQRHGQSQEHHTPVGAHHHHMICPPPPSNIRTVSRSDGSSITRLPSPMYRQVASGTSAPRADATSPRRGQVPSSGSHYPSRHGVRVLQKHEMGYLPSNKAQHPPGLPGNQAFIDQQCLYDQNDKGTLANLDPPISQAKYFDKMTLANQDGTLGQVHCDDDLQYGCLSNSHDVQGLPS